MENMSWEIIEAVKEYYDDGTKEGIELIKDCLFFLYYNSGDSSLQSQIIDWFNENHYCITCGSELITYEYEEVHTELDYNNIEVMDVELCPNCDVNDIERRY